MYRIPIKLCVCTLIIISCASAKVDPKPQQVIIKESFTIPNYNRFHSIDIVAYHPLPAHVKKILIQYPPSETKPDDALPIWNQAIQKTLLRNGFLILKQESSNELFKEETVIPNYDAVCIIDSIQLTKQTETIPLEHADDTSHYDHHISYYIASISVCIAVNETILWRGDVTLTSFDLLLSKNLIQEPIIYKTITCDYSYSKKLKQWVKDTPAVSVTDNFSEYYNEANIILHEKELINAAVLTLFNQVRVAQ